MVFTDPPYGYEYQSNARGEKFEILKNDDKILDFFPNIQMVCNGFIFICTTWKVLDKWLPLFKKYHNLTNMIIWDKGGGALATWLTHSPQTMKSSSAQITEEKSLEKESGLYGR